MTNLRMILLLRLKNVSLQPPTLPRRAASSGKYVMADSTLIMTLRALLAARKGTTLKIHDVKTDWLEDLIDELQGQPLLIAYQFEHDLDRLLERFGKTCPVS
jgi:hypothetical protein